MAGIGVNLNRIYEKHTLTTNIMGFTYSTAVTIAPMLLVIGNILLMGQVLGFSKVNYSSRELFACTVLYIFIFALLGAAPFNAVLSRYMSDVIYDETYEDILPCFYVGLILNLTLSVLPAIPFCIHEYLTGQVDSIYIFTGFCGYIALVLVFYAMLYLSICKDYKKISLFFFIGMATAFVLACIFVKVAGFDVPYAMLLALACGFLTIACLEVAQLKCYFRQNSGNYSKVLSYFKKYWKLVVTNFLYILGLYIHNFVFWTTDLKIVVANSFVCAEPYDLASCLAMFTNISATVIFISRVEMNFHEKYKKYSEAVTGGRWEDIKNTKDRMFRQLAGEIMTLVRIQFIISVVMYLLFVVLLPQVGFAGLVMRIYPGLAVGYFILFVMYAAIIFLYYFNDMNGAMITSILFCAGTFGFSILATQLPPIWYGLGLIAGSFAGFCMAYERLRWVERNMDVHVFCQGTIIKRGKGVRPSEKVYERTMAQGKQKEEII